jgi:tetratricopeptide (TPR) repeat protein
LKDLAFEGDVEVTFEFEGPGEVMVALVSDPKKPQPVFTFGAGGVRADSGKPESLDTSRPLRVERRGFRLRVMQGERELCSLVDAANKSPLNLVLGAKSDSGLRNLTIIGSAPGEMTRRLGALERLEGGAQAGDFRLDPIAMDAEAMSRAALAEAALVAGQLEEAWNLAEEAVAKAPTGGLAIAIRGLIRLAQGEIRLAVSDADLALALDPCRGEVVIRARRILAALRGPGAVGAHRRLETGSWDMRSDATEERLKYFAGKLDETSKRFAEALKEAGPAPKGIRAAVFASRDAYFTYLEASDGREAVIVDEPGAENELVRLAARSYIRAAVPAAPAWLEEGLAAHLAGENRAAEMKSLLAGASPLEALLRKPSGLTEAERIQSASVVRFFQSGAYKGLIPDLLKKLQHGVPAMEAFTGKNLQKLDAEWRTWAAADSGK